MKAIVLLVAVLGLLAFAPGVCGSDDLDTYYVQMVRWDPFQSQVTIAIWDYWNDPAYFDYYTVKAFFGGELVGQKIINRTAGSITKFIVTVPTTTGGMVDRIEIWDSHAETDLTYEVDGDSGYGSGYWLPANESIADIQKEHPQAKNITVESAAWINGSIVMSWNITGIDWENVSSFEVIDRVPTRYHLVAWCEDDNAYSMPSAWVNVIHDRDARIAGIWGY